MTLEASSILKKYLIIIPYIPIYVPWLPNHGENTENTYHHSHDFAVKTLHL